MLKKRRFVALSKAVARPEQMLPFVAEHLVRGVCEHYCGTRTQLDDLLTGLCRRQLFRVGTKRSFEL
jgi:hypothetical protein